MEKKDHVFDFQHDFELESGEKLPGFRLHYTTVGTLNAARSNVVWVCHALTGSSDFTSWWNELFTSGSAFDPGEFFIISANMLGGCYGSTGPLSVNPGTQTPYYHNFPLITTRDSVRAFDLLRQSLNLQEVHTLIGGSLGGQQVLEWAILQPQVFRAIVPIACNAKHSPWGIAWNEAQRMAIEADATWNEDRPDAGLDGLRAARAIGMISYRHYDTYGATQKETGNDKHDDFRASSYQRYQGQKLANRFNAFTYYALSKTMDSHNVGRGRSSAERALALIRAKTLVVSIASDILFPPSEQEFLGQHIPGARVVTIDSIYGHDGFLVEFNTLNRLIKQFNNNELSLAS
jgi:homoserine O-acetyltransferase